MNLKIIMGLSSLTILVGSMLAIAQSIPTVTPQETGASRPLDVSGPPYDGQYRETSAQIPPNSTMDWWSDIDGAFITWEGRYRLCLTFRIYGAGPNGEDLITSSPCPCPELIFTPAPTRTPTVTGTPTVTPTSTRTPTPVG